MIQRAPPVRRSRRPLAVAFAVLLVAAAGAGAAFNWWPAAHDPAAHDPAAHDPIGQAVALEAPPPTASEAAIDAEPSGDPVIVRFASNPHIYVLDFTSLTRQGAMLNRIAALVEKSGSPRDRVLSDSELAAAIAASGSTPETFYYGHDYRAADLARFFALADRDHVTLTPSEESLRRTLAGQGLLAADAVGAVISIPVVGADRLVDALARATILHHELSHGEYFTVPAYAAWTKRFWEDGLTADEREKFRVFLADEGYDRSLADLMMNEMQAYLMHTRDPRFFSARAVNIAPDRLALLQANFLLGMPAGWLRDCTPAP